MPTLHVEGRHMLCEIQSAKSKKRLGKKDMPTLHTEGKKDMPTLHICAKSKVRNPRYACMK